MQLTQDEQQVVLGTLLGNSYLKLDDDHPYLMMRNTDELWVRCKVAELQNMPGVFWKRGKVQYWTSQPNDGLNDIHSLCYASNEDRQVSMQWLDCLRDIGIAIWYCDSSCLVGRSKRHVCLRTQHFGAGANVIAQYFNEVLCPDACKVNYVRKKPVVVFSIAGTNRLIDIVQPFIPATKCSLVPKEFY